MSFMETVGLGSVGIIDALGFKGIWRRHSPDAVAATLREARRIGTKMAKDVLMYEAVQHVYAASGGHIPEISALSFSDNIFFTAVVPEARDRLAALAATTGVVAAGLSYIMRTTSQAEVPIIYRGVISAGDCIIDTESSLFIGEAVDEAGDLYEEADGAFVWLSPSAASLDYSEWSYGAWSELLVDYDVPLKGGRSFGTKVVNPCAHMSHTADEFAKIRAGHLTTTTSNDIGVIVKRQNAEKLFAQFERLSREHAADAEWERAAIARSRAEDEDEGK
jgi:hypothetical protein